MLRSILLVAAAIGLVSCGPAVVVPPVSPGDIAVVPVDPAPVQPDAATVVDRAADAVVRADVALERAERAYIGIRNAAEVVIPFLSPARAARVRDVQRIIETGFARARVATDLAVRAAELVKVATAARSLEQLVVDPD